MTFFKHSALNFIFSLLILALIACFAGNAWAETLYVKSSKTKMTEKPSARSAKVATLSAGTAVKVLKKEKRFTQISANGKTGWVFKFKLTSKAPAGGGGGAGLDALVGNQKMAAAESSSGSSIRGLSPLSEKQAKSRGVTQENIEAVKRMEKFNVSEAQLEKFLAEGKLREFAQ